MGAPASTGLGAGQAFWQPPQLFGSVLRSTHRSVTVGLGNTGAFVHSVSGGAQDVTHPEREHSRPDAHAVLHAPQWAAESRSASQPLDGSPSQSAQPGAQVPTAHCPTPAHVAAAWGTTQGSPAITPHALPAPYRPQAAPPAQPLFGVGVTHASRQTP